MQKYKKLISIAAVILIALGVNLDKFGIDLGALSGQETGQESGQQSGQSASQNPISSKSSTTSSTTSNGQLAEAWRSDAEPSNATQTRSTASQPQSNATNSRGSASARVKLPHWSNSEPEINLWHVFEGEINRKGKPTGFHSRPGGQDPANARVVSVKDKPNRQGVYTANIEVRDGGRWKSKFSSFFPDALSQQEVVDVIVHAYNNSKNPNKQPWSGPSGLGFQVQGYTTSRGGINTAFPVYQRN